MYQFRMLQEADLQKLTDCFNAAFSDYEQPIHFTEESFRYYLTASAVDLSLSFGAFIGDQPVGLILNSGGTYNGEAVVFDAGTGIIPEHRGKNVFSALFAYTCRQLQEKGITKYYLEVLQANQRAVSIYSKKGFSIVREYSVLVASGAGDNQNKAVSVVPYPEFNAFPTQFSVAPSFEHTIHNIQKNPHLYEVRYLKDQAYCIYAKRQGAIVQLHYNTLDALEDVLTDLIRKFPSSMAKNIDCNCGDVLQMLTQMGFREITKQYEMVKKI